MRKPLLSLVFLLSPFWLHGQGVDKSGNAAPDQLHSQVIPKTPNETDKTDKIDRDQSQEVVDAGLVLMQKIQSTPELSANTKDKAQGAAERVSRAKSPQDAVSILREEMHKIVSVLQGDEGERIPAENSRQIRNEAGAVSNRLGQYQDSLDLSNKVLDQNPDNHDALNNASRANYGLGNYEASIRFATRLTQIDPNNETAYTTRALAHYADGNYLQAAEDARRALALNKDNEIAFAALKMAEGRVHPTRLRLNQRQMAQAEEIKKDYQGMLQQMNQVETVGAQSHVLSSAETKIRGKDYWGAVTDASKTIKTNPKDAQAYYARAAARNLLGEYREALQDASMALSLNPSYTAAYDARAMAYNHLGRFREALDDATQSIALDGNNAYAYVNRAHAYEKLGDISSMMADYHMAARISPQFEPNYRLAAKAHALPIALFARNPAIQPPSTKSIFASHQFLVTLGFALVGLILLGMGFSHLSLSSHNAHKFSSSYKILRMIGEGGMSVVYEGLDTALGRRVAIKKMKEDWQRKFQQQEKFMLEARTVAALHHPNIVEIYSIVEHGEDLYLVFELVSGLTLADKLARRNRLSLTEVFPIIRDVCKALEYAHHHGIIHRDLKPSNIMVTEEGVAKVMDFGIARWENGASSNFLTTQTAIGTPQYMAPEAEQGLVRKETDVYALGVCLYEMLVGERPFGSTTASYAKMSRNYTRPSHRVPGLPRELDALIDDALQPDPDRRIHSAAEFLGRFEAGVRPARV